MKKTLSISLVILIFYSSNIFAQNVSDKINPDVRAERITEWMNDELGLDSTQVNMVQIINLKYAVKIESLKNSHSARVKKLQELRSFSSDKDNELKKVFTKKQFKIYQNKKQEIRKYLKSKN